MREIRLALLEADVNFKVVKSFTKTVKERCLGEDVVGGLNPGQQVVKIVDEELASLMGGAAVGVTFAPRPPTVDPARRPAGLRQDDGRRQARALPAQGARLVGRDGRLRRLPAGRRRSARASSARACRRRRLRARHRRGPREDRRVGARRGQAPRQGRADRRHRGPPARRRRPDGRAGRHPQGGQADADPARRRRDDRAGRRQRRPAVRRRGRSSTA